MRSKIRDFLTGGAESEKVWDDVKRTFIWPKPFPGPTEEASFLEHYSRRFNSYRQAAIILGALFWIAFIPWDKRHQANNPQIFTEEIVTSIQNMRYTVLLILCIATGIAVSSKFKNEKVATASLLWGIGSAAMGLLYVVFYVVPHPFNYVNYYVGIYLVVVFLFAFAHIRAKPATLTGLLLFLSIVALQLHTNALGREFASAIHYYLALFLMCHGVGVKFERYARGRFARERQLEREKQRAVHESKRADAQAQVLVRLKDEQRASAERASQEKSRFLAEAAHDLRQPVVAVDNFLTALSFALQNDDLERAKEHLKFTQLSLRHMRAAVNAVLEISHLESKEVAVRYSVFDLVDLVNDVVFSTAAFAKDTNVELRVQVRKATRVWVQSDRHLLCRIITNLVTNAIKYSDTRKHRRIVVIGIVCLTNKVRIDIIDNGIGIPRDKWGKIFEPFSQLANGQRDREKGFGLGLAIVAAITALLEEHRIELSSIEGIGSRFSVTAPLTGTSPRLNTGVLRDVEKKYSVQGAYVLVVEDDLMVKKSIAVLFEQYGILYEAAGSLQELESIISSMERDPDLLFTDYRLPDGFTGGMQ